ncbi:MAG: shikimate kinase AroK [Pseudomonadota bacterium]
MHLSTVILVGPMGAGKSTIGRQISNSLKKEFKDSDHEIVARTGASIPLIFEIEGEEGFRKREAAMIDELTQLDGVVLATGGGAVLRDENRQCLKERGVVIYLFASVDQLFERTSRDRNRPLLQTENPRQKLQDLMDQRDPLYREVADMVVHTDDRSIRSVVKEILVRLKQEPKYSGQ